MSNVKILFGLIICLFVFWGCTSIERGFRFRGEYRAPKSQYKMDVIFQGFVKPEADIAETAFSIIQFCPLTNAFGRSFRISMTSTPNKWIEVESLDFSMPITELNWKTSKVVVRNLLNKAGYKNSDSEELKDIQKVMVSSLSGPKGFIMKGQGKSIEVLREDIQYDYKVEKNKAQNTWINSSDLTECK